MNGYLVDTNVLSELTKQTPAPQVESFLRQSKDRVSVSVLTIGEIRKGIAGLPISNRRALVEDWLDNEIMPWLGNRVLPVSLAIAERWGDLAAQLKSKGKPKPVVDSILAATALEHDLILATRNVGDYADMNDDLELNCRVSIEHVVALAGSSNVGETQPAVSPDERL